MFSIGQRRKDEVGKLDVRKSIQHTALEQTAKSFRRQCRNAKEKQSK